MENQNTLTHNDNDHNEGLNVKKINVEEFVHGYLTSKKTKAQGIESYIKKHIVTEYIDVLVKSSYCLAIINSTSHINSNGRLMVKINSLARYILFTMRLIDLYTDIQIDFEDSKFINQYDELNKVGAIDDLICAIPEHEYSEFNTILKMASDDFYQNEYSTDAILYNLKESTGMFSETIADVVEEMNKLNEKV